MAEDKSDDKGSSDDGKDDDGRSRDDEEKSSDSKSKKSSDEKSSKGDDKDDGENGGVAGDRDLAWRAYLKLAATMLITLILFAGILRGCAACQQKNPITGESTMQPAPPP
jgi:hypothetical protein